MDIKSIITNEEYDNLENLNYDQFCTFLTKIVKLAVEEALKALPHVMSHMAGQVEYMKSLSSKFYIDNKDLAAHKPLVSKIIEQTESENPGLSLKEVLEISAKKAKELIPKMDKADLKTPKFNDLKTFDSKLKAL